nr:carboxypeptidase M32 [Halothermothrix orenii]
MKQSNTEKSFLEFVQKIKAYDSAQSLLYWDMVTGMPEKGVSKRASIISLLSTEVFKMSTSDKMKEYLDNFSRQEVNKDLDPVMKGIVRECKKNYDRFKKIPEDKYRDFVRLKSEAESIWKKAKQNDDFNLFRPYLEKIVDYLNEFIDIWGYEGNKYNTLLDHYEPGVTVEKLDDIFTDLKASIVPLLKRVKDAQDKPDDSFLKEYYDPATQEKLCELLLEEIGYDFKAGRLDESEHPFTIGINSGDVRVTTHYYPHNLTSALFSSLHEGGHAIYDQNIDPELDETPLHDGASMGIHESQSRFWENIIGRSYNFWKSYYGKVRKLFPEQLNDISLDEFYRAINKVEPSMIRVEADELTYNLHIMVRYEIEKALINRELEVAELPEVWNQKMKEYLGIEPENDKEGVLQDVHWSNALFGYFPSYALGNIYAAQFYNTIKKEINNYDELISKGHFQPIKEWLGDKIHKYGKLLTPTEIIKKVTGEEINSRYLIKYLENKYSKIYKL